MKQESRFWKRLKKNKAAMLSLGFIISVILVAIFAYPLCTDDTQDANRVILEIAAKPPSFQAIFLRKQNIRTKTNKRSFLKYLAYGRELKDSWIPVQNVRRVGDSLYYDYIIDETLSEPQVASWKALGASGKNKRKSIVEEVTVQKKFLLGTDRYGRDVLSRLLLGTRVSLAVGFIAVILSISIGVLLGAMGGYLGGRVDSFIVWLINVVWSIPTLLLVFAITFILGKGFWQIFIAVGLLKEQEYIQAAKTMGFSNARIILKHILPNVIGPTVVLAATNFATAILIEAGLSFLGIGVQPPTASWGLMIKENYNFIITNRPLLAIVPGIAIMLIVLAFNLLGNGLRDALDVKEKV